MPQYFFKFPKIINRNVLSTDLVTRIKIRDKYLDNEDLYHTYEMTDADSAEILASKYYGSSELHWIILITNNIFDKDFDFVMPYRVFTKYIEDKYKNNYGVQSLKTINSGSNYTDGFYQQIPLAIKNPTELTKQGKDILVNMMITNGSIIGDVQIYRGGVGYDANTIFTVSNSHIGEGAGIELSITNFMTAIEYTQTTTEETFGYQKEIRIIDTGEVEYEIATNGTVNITSTPTSILSRTIYNIGKTEYYNLYEGTDPHPAELVRLFGGKGVLYDSIRVEPITIYQHEQNLNEKRRTIRILKKEYFPQALKEFISLMAATYV